MDVGVVGASGYSGGELLRLLQNHPDFSVSYIAAGSNAGERITSVHPHLVQFADRNFDATSIDAINQCDLVFLALPHGESSKLISGINQNVKIVDLGADFRLHSASAWQTYYGSSHPGTWVYGLPEIAGNRDLISHQTRIANPGCYATAIALAAAPAISGEWIDADDIVVVAASGTTGAGRSAKVNLLGSEVMNSLTSYKFGGIHQHTPEIEETLSSITGSSAKISFTPILAPMPRGILATVTSKLTHQSATEEEIRRFYCEYYHDEPFVTVLPAGALPRTSAVLGSNSIHLQVAVDHHTNRLVISSAIDNLGKGVAGQAIQNANLIMGVLESAGLPRTGTP